MLNAQSYLQSVESEARFSAGSTGRTSWGGHVEAAERGFEDRGLGDAERALLAFERQWWRYEGSKEASIREHFDMNSTRYYQRLNQLLDMPEAMEFDPLLVKRLRRQRDSRARARSARRLGAAR